MSQTVMASRIVGFDGIHWDSVNAVGSKLLSWMNHATKEKRFDDVDIPHHIRTVTVRYSQLKGADAGKMSVAEKNQKLMTLPFSFHETTQYGNS